MKGLDTTVLIRYLTQDDAIQSAKATAIIEGRFSEEHPAFISLVTMAEIVWVLGSSYELHDAEIAAVIERLLQTDTLVIQNQPQVFEALVALKQGWAEFPDALIRALGEWAGCEATLTFDKKAAQLAGFELVR